MDEPMNRFEQRLESALRDYVERPESSWEPAAVVADVTSRARVAGPPRASWFMPARLATAAVVILAVGLTAVVGMRLVDRSNGPYPEYLSLRGPEDFYPEICDFYEPGHAASPTECRPPIPETAEPSRSVAISTAAWLIEAVPRPIAVSARARLPVRNAWRKSRSSVLRTPSLETATCQA